MELSAVQAELHHHRVTRGRRKKLMRDVPLDFFLVDHAFDHSGHLIDDRSPIRRFAREQANFVSDRVTDFGRGEPRKIVEQNRIGGRFLDLEFEVYCIPLRGVSKVDRGKYTQSGEAVGGGLDWRRGNYVPFLKSAGGNNLIRRKFLTAGDLDGSDA